MNRNDRYYGNVVWLPADRWHDANDHVKTAFGDAWYHNHRNWPCTDHSSAGYLGLTFTTIDAAFHAAESLRVHDFPAEHTLPDDHVLEYILTY